MEQPTKRKLSIIRRVLYGICGIGGPKIEVSADGNYHQSASRPHPSESSKEKKKRPPNVSVQEPGSLCSGPQSPRSVDVQLPMGDNYYHNIPDIFLFPNSSGAPAPNGNSNFEFGENPQYESATWAHPRHATSEVVGQIPWRSQPKDDGSMLRLFKTVDGRLMDHILNFYIAPDGMPYQGGSDNSLSAQNHQFLDSYIPDWQQLLSKQESRISILRAIIARVVLGDKTLQASSTGSSYDPGNMMHQVAETAHDLTKSFALKGSNEDARFRSMQALVSATSELYSTISSQPTKFDVAWGKHGPEAILDTTMMEAVLHSNQASRTVRTTVFPGLLKQYGPNALPLPLAKIQVLLY